jgi:sugar lactone lactonase YvrE
VAISRATIRACWVVDDDAIWKFDAGRPRRIDVGSQPLDTAATAGGVWVATSGNQTLLRVDPTSGRVVARIKLHHPPVAVAAGGGVVAVVLQ